MEAHNILLEWGVRSSLAIALVAIILFFSGGKYLAPKTRFNVWFGSLVAVSGLIFAMSWLPEWRILDPGAQDSSNSIAPFGISNETKPVATDIKDEIGNSNLRNSDERDSSEMQFPWLLAIWLVGIVLLIVRLLTSFYLLSRNHQPVSEGHAGLGLCEELCQEIGLQSPVQLVEGEGSAMTWGIFRPKISLPKAAVDWPEERLEMVLRHEIAHLKRRDPLLLALSQIVAAAAWFHPGIWIITKRLSVERESATDELVLAQGIRPSSYATAILELSVLSPAKARSGVPSLALCGMSDSANSKSDVEKRVKRVLDPPPGDKGKFVKGVSLLILGLIVAAGLLAFVISRKKPTSEVFDSPITIVIDAGHGSHDFGGKTDKAIEKNLALDISKRVELKLRSSGNKVVMTRNDDTFLTLDQRMEIANQSDQPAVMVSIHCNSSSKGTTRGIECYTGGLISEANELSEALGGTILRNSVAETGAVDRGLKKSSRIKFFRSRTVPTVLIECGFITHPDEVVDLTNPEYREKLAVGITNGVIEFLSATPVESRSTTVNVTEAIVPAETKLEPDNEGGKKDPSDLWYRSFLRWKKAESHEKGSKPLAALNEYSEAKNMMVGLYQDFPDFQPEIVPKRLELLSEKIVELKDRLQNEDTDQ